MLEMEITKSTNISEFCRANNSLQNRPKLPISLNPSQKLLPPNIDKSNKERKRKQLLDALFNKAVTNVGFLTNIIIKYSSPILTEWSQSKWLPPLVFCS